MTEEIKAKLKALAEKYENEAFPETDPCQFLRWYTAPREIELCSFIAAMLSFGNRKQFIPKIREIMEIADRSGGICRWLESEGWKKDFHASCGNDEAKFYRFYSYNDMAALFKVLGAVSASGGLGKAVQERLPLGINEAFAQIFCDCSIVPKGKNSASKRIHMFLRWMVRRNSPVDSGLWNWYSPADLIIPLDTHVIQEAEKLGLIPEKSAGSIKTAMKITEQLKEIWPEDPCKGDFALFGLGVDSENKE